VSVFLTALNFLQQVLEHMPQDIPQLGTIAPVNMRTVWENEGLHFTPWLARSDNLALIANALQLGSLTLEGTELRVGEFFADIVARDEQDNLVIIENQFGSSDHDHLGKALTYLAGVAKAKKLVWIAERVREPHRAVIDWLNANTPEDVAFFGVEIELLRIDTSRPAPRFNLVCKPNNWARRVARQAASGDWSEDKKWCFAYWSAFATLLEDRRAEHWMRDTPTSMWWGGSMGRTGFRLFATVRRNAREVRVELSVAENVALEAFRQLVVHRAEVEHEVGGALVWQEPQRPGQRANVSVSTTQFDPDDEKRWQQQHEWLLKKMEAFRKAFRDRIAQLTLNAGGASIETPEE
jgi:hypothetical protein